jgi:hypothetical protein
MLNNQLFWEYVADRSGAGTFPDAATAEERVVGSGLSGTCSSSIRSAAKLPLAMVAGELVSQQPRNGRLFHKAMIALAAQLSGVHGETTAGRSTRIRVIDSYCHSEEMMLHALGSVSSAVQEYGIVQVLETVASAKQMFEWGAPSAHDRRDAFDIWVNCINAAVGGDNRVVTHILQLKETCGMKELMMMTIRKLLPGGMQLLTAQPTLVRGTLSMGFVEVALQSKTLLTDTGLISFCCCNPDCTSLQGVSELGLVLRAERYSSSSQSSRSGLPRHKVRSKGVCAGCLTSCYCSRECQRQHWDAGHKETCGALAGGERLL